MQTGDTFTVHGCYQRQTWWQRLLRRPRRLQVFTVTHVVSSKETDAEAWWRQ